MGKTTIEWTDASWNPVTGCNEVSPGCANCYAARLAATRLKNVSAYKGLAILRTPQLGDAMHTGELGEERKPRWTGEVRLHPDRLEEPLHWKKPRKIFVCDMADLFHESVHSDWIDQVFAMIYRCPHHTFQILTKRAHRMQEFMRLYQVVKKNVWLGVSVENQHFADERIRVLLDTPAAVRWISAEPLLGPVDLTKWLAIPVMRRSEAKSISAAGAAATKKMAKAAATQLGFNTLDWVVCGGESGANARAMHPDWARSLRDQCQAAGVPFFFKQWGEYLPALQDGARGKEEKWAVLNCGDKAIRVGKKVAGRRLDGRTWDEFPNQLR